MAATYILYSEKLGRYYIGATGDLGQRLMEHNTGKGGKFTASGKPWKVVFTEHFDDIKQAKARERAIKSKKSRKYIEYLVATHGEG